MSVYGSPLITKEHLDGQFFTNYFASLKGVADEILLYHPLNCDAKTRQAQWEEFLLAKFLSGLDSILCATQDSLLSNDSVPTLSNALSRVLRVSSGSTLVPPPIETSALAIRGCGSSRGRSSREDEAVTHPEWANALSSEPNVSVSESDQVSLSREAYERLIHQPVANSTSSTATPSHGKPWLLDSGATTHITGNKSCFTSLSMSTLSLICLVDGTRSPVSSSGIVHPSKDLILDNILFAPHFPDLQTKKTIGDGHERDGLYYLDTTTTPVSAHTISATISPFQWHCCLGHPSLAKLEQLLPLESAVSKLECEFYELGKHHRVSYPSRVNNCSSSPFDLVHSNVWGPSRIEFVGGLDILLALLMITLG
ncbi:Retrovirus-related Pol polyprotein from transposon RE2 [Sesamum angolense]|uniref:Retrovirus-related Pol polyprotein from transposon RE2 n=1 Tax=Sesamum angolense TaxID=2727404 RepID=A0AAE1T5F2_9LAMI|nr:Retrovirus-related Pol polyprotein from transposon RE2 [Sesamum angolense]